MQELEDKLKDILKEIKEEQKKIEKFFYVPDIIISIEQMISCLKNKDYLNGIDEARGLARISIEYQEFADSKLGKQIMKVMIEYKSFCNEQLGQSN